MTETIIIGVLSLAGTLCGAYFANRKSTALIAYRLEQLEDKVHKHNEVIKRTYELEKDAKDLRDKLDEVNLNPVIERTYKLEQDAAVFHEQLKVANHRIDDLESK